MKMVEDVGEPEDWAEADGWVGKMIISEKSSDREYIYRVREGKMVPVDHSEVFTATIRMSSDTFLDIVEGALNSAGEETFMRKYANGSILYYGERWIVDSERFKKAFRRMGQLDPMKAIKAMK